jgi:TetR/AcrR family transcriptional regulator, ethionamide resistance regulator
MRSITRRGGARADQRASVEERILATTERLLTEGASFTELGLQRIAAEAGVARSTLYTYFPDKPHLLTRLASDVVDTSFAAIAPWQPVGPGGGLDGYIRLFSQVIANYRQHAAVVKALDETSAYDASVAEYWASRFNLFLENGERMVRDEQRAGRTPATLDAAMVTRLCVLGGHRFIVQHVATDDGSGDAVAARELASTWWYGIFRRPAG